MLLKKLLSIFLTVLITGMTFTAFPVTANAASGTWDPEHGVYDITTVEDLFAFNHEFWDEEIADGMYYTDITVNLLADITIPEGENWESAPANLDPERCFCGTFNGNGHTIGNLNMVSSDNDTVSFLPILCNATIKDLTLKDVTIENGRTWNAAFACASLGDDTLSNCHLIGNCAIIPYDSADPKSSGFTGGLIGAKHSGTLKIENCSVGDADSDIKINTPSRTTYTRSSVSGGVLGYVDEAVTTEIISTDNYADISCDNYSAGIIGFIDGGTDKESAVKIIGCRNYGDVHVDETSINSGFCLCAGIVGYQASSSVLVIDQCSNHGDISMNCDTCIFSCGGIAAELRCAAVLNSYNTGKVEAEPEDISVGGVVAHIRTNDGFTMPDTDFFEYYPAACFNAIINCYNVGDVIANQTEYVGGVCGYVQDYYSVEQRSVIRNAYNFATVSGLSPVGTVVGCVQDTMIQDVYGQTGSHALDSIEINLQNVSGVETCVSEVGYFDTPEVTGTIYPAAVKAKGADLNKDTIIETISSTPLSGNLLTLLNKKVEEYNSELEASGSEYRYLTWKMTSPASEDGYKGETVHPMFGIQEFDVRFYPNFAENEEPFRTYTTAELVMGKVPVFYDLPEHEGYIFKGWYQDKDNDDFPISFDTVYTQSADIYAHWITVEDVAQDAKDANALPDGETSYGGFDLSGVQIKDRIIDTNFDYRYMPGGMRFVASLSMDVVNEINALQPDSDIEYGFVAATDKDWIDYHKAASRKLLYGSTTANGVDTVSDNAANENYFGFAKSINCTSKQANAKDGRVIQDHRNFSDYLLYTLVITYEDAADDDYDAKVLAHPYIRYFDANGLERVAYSEYRGGSNTLGGCYVSYNEVAQ